MTDEEKKETSEDAAPEEPQAEETPAEETPADPGREAEESAVDGEAQPSADDDPSDTPSEEADGPDATAGSPEEEADGPAADAESPETAEEPETADEAPAVEEAEAPKAEESKEKKDKKDVIPGADLEPIAVESDARPLSAEERARLEAEEEERASREAELVGGADEEPSAASRAPAKMESGARFLATGKRKRSIARVTVLPGSGKIEINKRELEEFFPRPLHQTMARQPLTTTGYEDSVDVRVRVHGGGVGGQAGAVRHGIAKALTEIDPELRGELKRRGFLTRDARVKERRKAGLKKARKRPQFSKR
jgi:small subunit ribosomal protein S9